MKKKTIASQFKKNPFLEIPQDIIRFHQEKEDALSSTKGYKKLWNYFIQITKSDFFINTTKELRLKYKIPEDGFEKPNIKLNPETRCVLTEEWTYYTNDKKWGAYKEDIKKICKRYHLHYMDWFDILSNYLMYNELKIPKSSNSFNLCLASDLVQEKKESFGKEYKESDDMAFPIAIRISPYASQRDIVDFIKKSYNYLILPDQMKYRDSDIKIGREKTKDEKIQKRNQFIYNHRHLPRKKIADLLVEEFKDNLDYGHIGKIISLENKKRK